jgi:flagella basal body P-ring formation protein FlgA
LRAGQPIRTREVQDPILVPRRSLVTILYQHPRMTLTAKGRALEDGSDGQVIRISNSQSSNVIEAVVVGDHTVAVSAPNHVVMN